MSLQQQKKFLSEFETRLAKQSRVYRRYQGNRVHHNFTVTKRALHRAIRDSLLQALDEKKDARKLVAKVLKAIDAKSLEVIKKIADNVKRRGQDTNSVVVVVVTVDTPTVFKAHFSASQQDNGKFRNIYKQVYTSYDKILNEYSEYVSEMSLKIAGASAGSKGKDYFNLEHFLFQGIAESQVKDALIDSIQDLPIEEAEVLQWLKASGLDVRIVRDTKTDTMSVFIGSKIANAKEAAESRVRKQDLQKFIKDQKSVIESSGQRILELPGSDSFVDIKRKKLLKKVADEFSKSGNAKVKLENTTVKHRKTSVSKTTKRKSTAVKGAALTRKAGGSSPRRAKKGVASSPIQLIGIFNARLPKTVAKNMGSPKLNYRTGRFASSVKVVDYATTKEGFNSFGYTYQKDPYQVFESTSGSKFSSVERDPRVLIEQSMREIATEMAIGRFYTRRV